METEFIFWRHATPAGITIEEICGGEDKEGAVWKAMALQVFAENGGDRYRVIEHTPAGAPLLAGEPQRISVSHTPHFWVAGFLPRTPEADPSEFSIRTAFGIDAERDDREQVLKVAPRVMSADEIAMAEEYSRQLEAGDSHHSPLECDKARVRAFVLGWTIKEALYKAALKEGLDYRSDLQILRFPEICSSPNVRNSEYGKGRIIRRRNSECGNDAEIPRECCEGGGCIDMELFSYESEGHIITLAYSPKCAKFKKG